MSRHSGETSRPSAGQPEAGVGPPQRAQDGSRRDAELQRRDATARRDDAGQLAQRRGRVVDVAQEVGERQVVELAVGERQPLGLADPQRDARAQQVVVLDPGARPCEHRLALVDPDDRAAVPAHERRGDHPGPGRDVQHAVLRSGLDRGDHRAPPARVLAEAQGRADAVVVARQAREQRERVLLALRGLARRAVAHGPQDGPAGRRPQVGASRRGPDRTPLSRRAVGSFEGMTETTNVALDQPEATQARAFGAPAADAPLAPQEIQRRAIGARDVRIDIKFCGVCHSDIHFTRGEWGEVPYPAIPGHEIAGVVAAVGADVTGFAPGDRVGVGCMVELVPRVRELRQGRGAVLHPRQHADLRVDRPRRHAHLRRLLRPRRRRRGLRPADPGRARARRRRAAAVRRHHHLLAAAPLGRRAGQARRGRRPRRSRPHGRQDRPRDGRRGDRPVADAAARRTMG